MDNLIGGWTRYACMIKMVEVSPYLNTSLTSLLHFFTSNGASFFRTIRTGQKKRIKAGEDLDSNAATDDFESLSTVRHNDIIN